MRERRPNVYGVSRDLWDHPLFKAEPYTEAQAWAWLIGAAAWKGITTRGNVGPVKLARGEFSFSVRFLAKKFKWDKDRAHRFMIKLRKHDMIGDSERDGNQVHSINNYNRFQIVGAPKCDTEQDIERDTDATAPRHDRDKEETGETGKQVIEQQEPPANAVALFPEIVSRETKVAIKYPVWLDPSAWDGFKEMRRRKRAPLTDRAENQIIAKLERWRALGHDPTAILDKSTENSWTTIYEPKDEGRHGQRTKPASAHDKFNAGVGLYLDSLGADADEIGEGQIGGDVGPARLPLLAS